MKNSLKANLVDLTTEEMASITAGSFGEWLGCQIANAVNTIKDWSDRFILNQNDFEHNPIT